MEQLIVTDKREVIQIDTKISLQAEEYLFEWNIENFSLTKFYNTSCLSSAPFPPSNNKFKLYLSNVKNSEEDSSTTATWNLQLSQKSSETQMNIYATVYVYDRLSSLFKK